MSAMAKRFQHLFQKLKPLTWLIITCYALNLLTGFGGDIFLYIFPYGPMLKLCLLMATIWNFQLAQKTTFVEVLSEWWSHDHSCNVCIELVYWFRGEILKLFPIGTYVKTMPTDGSHLEFLSVICKSSSYSFWDIRVKKDQCLKL